MKLNCNWCHGIGMFLAALVVACNPTQAEVEEAAPTDVVRQEAAVARSAGTLIHARDSHTVTSLLDGRILFVGGSSGEASWSAELYDPRTGNFALAAALRAPRRNHQSVRLADGRVLVVGGLDSTPQAAAFLYQPTTDTWNLAGSMSTARQAHTATLLPDGRVLVVGGMLADFSSTSSVELFDPATGTWSAGPSLNGARANHTATLLSGGQVLISSGFPAATGQVPQVYDPVTNTWSSTGLPTVARYGHSAQALPDGRVLVVGGINVSTFAALDSAECYLPGANVWGPVASMSAARKGTALALLASGKVLALGGYVGASYVATVERFDPVTGTWSAADPMWSARWYAGTAVFAGGDRVLVAGGQGNALDAEIYTDGPCVPITCATQAGSCGSFADQCGARLACGSCASGEVCLEGNTCGPVPPGFADYDAVLKTPRCADASASCDSGLLLLGRGPQGLEDHQPNTLGGSCADGTSGLFHTSPSLDRLKVSTLDGAPLAPGKQVRIEATLWGQGTSYLDFYVTDSVQTPTWRFVNSRQMVAVRGNQTVFTDTTLPVAPGPVMAVRGVFRTDAFQAACWSDLNRDTDDLAFVVDPSSYDAPPSVQVTAPAANALVAGSVQVEAQATDDRGIARVEFFLDQTPLGSVSAAPYVLSWDTTVAANGYHDLQARAHDSGGQSTTATVRVRVGNDRTAPVVQVTKPTEGQRVGRLIIVAASASDDVGVTQLEAYVDGVRILPASGNPAEPWPFQWDTSLLADGPHDLVARAYDGAGRFTDSAPVQFISDNTAPTFTVVEPANGATVTGLVRVRVDAADPSGMSAVYMTVDGKFTSDLVAPFEFTWDSTQATPGTYALVIEARDAVANLGSTTVNVVVPTDTVPPTVSLTAPLGGAQVSGTVSVTAVAADDRRVASVSLWVDGNFSSQQSSATPTFSWNTQALANGTHRLVAKASDVAGNVTASAPVDVVVNNPKAAVAEYDSVRRAPGCAAAGSVSCDSGTLLSGRGTVGPEGNAPNTLAGSCSDGTGGTFHADESLDRLKVATVDGLPIAAGKTVRIEATVWAWSSGGSDALDLYTAADASAPQWVKLTTLVPTASGQQVLSATYTLPTGAAVQAIRGLFRYGSATTACAPGGYNDHDDLFFAVQ